MARIDEIDVSQHWSATNDLNSHDLEPKYGQMFVAAATLIFKNENQFREHQRHEIEEHPRVLEQIK